MHVQRDTTVLAAVQHHYAASQDIIKMKYSLETAKCASLDSIVTTVSNQWSYSKQTVHVLLATTVLLAPVMLMKILVLKALLATLPVFRVNQSAPTAQLETTVAERV
jgi:hypothetical protein